MTAGAMSGSVPLHVDDEVAVEAGRDLGETVGARRVIGAGHPHLAAERVHGRGDPVVVGRDEDAVDRTGVRRVPVDVLDHRPAADVRQRLGRQSGRCVAGGDDGDGSSGGGRVPGEWGRGGAHSESYHVGTAGRRAARGSGAGGGRRAAAGLVSAGSASSRPPRNLRRRRREPPHPSGVRRVGGAGFPLALSRCEGPPGHGTMRRGQESAPYNGADSWRIGWAPGGAEGDDGRAR